MFLDKFPPSVASNESWRRLATVCYVIWDLNNCRQALERICIKLISNFLFPDRTREVWFERSSHLTFWTFGRSRRRCRKPSNETISHLSFDVSTHAVFRFSLKSTASAMLSWEKCASSSKTSTWSPRKQLICSRRSIKKLLSTSTNKLKFSLSLKIGKCYCEISLFSSRFYMFDMRFRSAVFFILWAKYPWLTRWAYKS